MTLFNFFTYLIIGLYAILNVGVAIGYPPKEMINEFWIKQGWCGKIASNLFYAPAWAMRGIAWLVIVFIFWFFKTIYIGAHWVVHKMYQFYNRVRIGEI